jgi:hypothetical protein
MAPASKVSWRMPMVGMLLACEAACSAMVDENTATATARVTSQGS